MANKIFRQVLCSERLPSVVDCNYVCVTDKNTFDIVYFNGIRFEVAPYEPQIIGWIESIELPNNDIMQELADKRYPKNYFISTTIQRDYDLKRNGFKAGFNKAIELIKGEGLNNPTTN